MLQDKNLSTNPSHRVSALWRLLLQCTLDMGIDRLFWRPRTSWRGVAGQAFGGVKSHVIFVVFCEGCEIPEVSPKEARFSLGYGFLNSSI